MGIAASRTLLAADANTFVTTTATCEADGRVGSIADYLDQALFDSVVAGEIRRLGTATGFDRLFDLLSQLVSQITSYRWLAVSTESPGSGARRGVGA